MLVELSHDAVFGGWSKTFVHGTYGRGERAASVENVEFLAGLVEGDNCGFQLCFSFRFLVCCVDAVEIGASQFPGEIEMSPDVVDDLLEPSLAGELLGANLVVVVDVVLLDLDPVMTEAAS